MAAYDSLIDKINRNVKQNAHNEITGAVLNETLQSMVETLGEYMRFVGIANEQTVPSQEECPKFYLAFVPGSYTNFFSQRIDYESGVAIIYDQYGTNTWQIGVYQIQSSPNPSFVVDAEITDNEYDGGTIIYVSEAKRLNNGSRVTVSATDTRGSSPVTVAVIEVDNYSSGFPSGFATYTAELTGTEESVLKLRVNWDVLTLGEIKTFGLEESLPKSAYGKLSAPVDVSDIYDRVEELENEVGYGVSTSRGETPEFEYGGDIYEVYEIFKNNTLDINKSDSGNNPFTRIGAKYVYKVPSTGMGKATITLSTTHLSGRNFYCKIIVLNESTSQSVVLIKSSDSTNYPIIGGAPEIIVSPNNAAIIEVCGVKSGIDEGTLNDTYYIAIKSIS